MAQRLSGKVAIITGGASGIGAAVVRKFAEEGAQVVAADIDDQRGSAVADEVSQAGGCAVFKRTDVSRAAEVESLVSETVDRFGKLDVVLANAGFQFIVPLADVSEQQWDHLMAVNLKGVFFCCKYAIPPMTANGGGSMIATGSVLSTVAAAGFGAYCASKAAVLNLMRATAVDYGHLNIRANCLCPGCVDTPLADEYWKIQSDPEQARQASAASHLLGRIGRAEEIANAAVFLASDESSFVTGSALFVDGGLCAKL